MSDALKLAAAGAGGYLAARAVYRRFNGYDFRGKTVLITGGSRGLGLVLARGFASEGARVAVCARDPRELERARADLARRGADAFAFPCDVSDRAQVKELVDVVTHHFGRVDVLVNNAGVIQVGPVEEMTLEDYEQAMAVHFWGPLYATLAVLPQMRARRDGRVVNVSSIGGKISVPHLVPYCASKFALAGLSDGLRAELAKDGVVVTSVFPGLMRTGSPRNASFKGQHRAEYAWFAISDSLPVSSIGAERAAAQIIDACRHGRAELVITTQAQLAVKFRALFPEAAAELLAVVNRLLPGPGGIGRARAKGRESESALAPSVLTTLTEWAAQRNNEMVRG
ncbi:MAG: SDR family NAD(P)-dependent oxidoreductase [Acidobacteria bacterium]|nr:SDR family NAD(P)-dependent oxidoreductase [Acidobacteriota bacterium]